MGERRNRLERRMERWRGIYNDGKGFAGIEMNLKEWGSILRNEKVFMRRMRHLYTRRL